MTRALLALCLLLPAAAWAGSPFAGSWRGYWNDPGNGQSGPVALVIDGDGGVGGEVGNRALGALAPISGHIGPGGATILTYTYDNGVTFFRALGQIRLRRGRLTGMLDFITPQGARLGRGVFELDPG